MYISRTGDSFIIFGYNGRDGVVTDKNGLIYMRARYYSPDMKRFINADIVAGTITNAATLNRYAYANANPVMFIDPLGLYYCGRCGDAGCGACLDKDTLIKVQSGEISNPNKQSTDNSGSGYKPSQPKKPSTSWDDENGEVISKDEYYGITDNRTDDSQTTNNNRDYEEQLIAEKNVQEIVDTSFGAIGFAWDILTPFAQKGIEKSILNSPRPINLAYNTWTKHINGEIVTWNTFFQCMGYGITAIATVLDVGMGIEQNIANGEPTGEIVSDATIGVIGGAFSITTGLIGAKVGMAFGTAISPIVGTAVGGTVGFCFGLWMSWEYSRLYDESIAPRLDYLI